jgi:hypothetical protein
MIELKSNGTAFEMFPETTLALELNNPMFTEGEFIPGSFTLPIEVPANSAINRQKLQNPTLITNKQRFANNIPSQLFYKKVPYLHGKVNVKPVTPTKIPLSFVTEASALPDIFKNTSIRSLPFETFYIREDWSDGLDYGEGNEKSGKILVFERDIDTPLGDTTEILINGQRFISDNNIFGLNGRVQEIVQAINATDVAFAQYTAGTAETPLKFKIRSAEPSIDSLLEVDMLDYDNWLYVAEESYINDYRETVKDYLNGFKNAAYPAQKFAFPTYYNKVFYNEATKNTSGVFNHYFEPNYVINTYDIDNPTNSYGIIPFMFLKYVLDKIAEFTGVTIKGNFFFDPEINKLLIYNTFALDHFERLNKGVEFNIYASEINPSNHLPDMKLNDFFKALQSTFCLGLFYNPKTNTLEMLKLNDIISKNEYIDLTDKAENFDEHDNSESTGITFKGKADEKDELFKTNTTQLTPYVMGEGKETIEAGFSTVYEKTYSFPIFTFFPLSLTYHSRKVIHAQQAGGDGAGPRLFFYRGMVNDSQGSPYPFGTAYNLDPQGNKIGKYSLDWNGPDGLAEVWWNYWKTFLYTRAYQKRKIRLSLRNLINLDWRKKYRIDRVLYYIKKVNVVFTMNIIKTATVELYKIGKL